MAYKYQNVENHIFIRRKLIDFVNMDTDQIIDELDIQDTDLEIDPDNKKRKVSVAKQFSSLLNQGYTPGEAAHKMNTSVKTLFTGSNVQFKNEVASLVENSLLPAELRKELVRAGLNRMFVENVKNPNPENQKIALGVAKQISMDPEVGLNVPPQIGVQINLDNTPLLDKIKDEITIETTAEEIK